MRILVLNGSPRPKVSNTMILTTAFLAGMGKHDTEIVNIADERIEPCRGCYICWEKTPGECVIQDDMEKLLQKYREADLVVWSFPLYYFSMPSKIKAFTDRLLPLILPVIHETADGKPFHPERYDLSAQRHILISTCGFFTVENNFDALVKQFDIMFDSECTKILCPQSELFKVSKLKGRTDEYLELLKQAGNEYFTSGAISAETEKQLSIPLFEKDVFLQMANANWNITETKISGETPVQPSQAERLLRQMSALYTPQANAPKTEKHIEFFFSDINETYQIRIHENKAEVVKDTATFAPYSVRIETPFDVWRNISSDKISGTEALYQRKYRVVGDFPLMTTLMSGFSVGRKNQEPKKKRSLMIFLSPFIALWVLLPALGSIGAYAAILTSASVPLLTRFFRLSPYDSGGAFIISALSLAFLAGVPYEIIVILSYILFGGLWLISLLFRIPLCAWYSANNYGEDDAFANPLFIRTNRILAGLWGLLYICTSVWTWFLLMTAFAPYIGLINSLPPVLMGIFTVAFVKWYPAHYASKKSTAESA